ncbi:interferon-induced very large GTPase 1-like [Mytilus edulis]|uniref:interferon-induced very large GTPase 1-like n=1 Tax=Mytilus edulis TaxID=6550 RepID=UPI0039EFD766
MSKWAFRKVDINRKKDGEWVEEDALSQDIKKVTFLRIGPSTHETVSKSNMINEILSNQKPPTFFNKKACMSFETEKLITNGMVEASWFIPSNSDSANVSQDVVMFLNLRGNCLHYEEEIRTVSSISDVVIVLINIHSLDKLNIVQTLKKIHSFDKCIIYGIESRKEEAGDITKVQDFKKQFLLNNENMIRVGGEIDFTIAQRFQRKIRKSLLNTKAKRFAEVISDINFGDEHFSIEGYTMSKDIIDFINKQPDKRTLFPLQGRVWKELCFCTKKLFRSKLEDELEELKRMKYKIEQQQFDLIEKSETLQQFTRNMLSTAKLKESNNEKRFFIAWMKTFMDERLRSNQKYNQKTLSFTLTHCYDHFIREMGLAFSIQVQHTIERKTTYRSEVGIFQKFVSNMLQFGFPFEFMNGDTGMVPLQWVKAVLSQLKEDIGDQNVYVISVLGIQSSGKSTLLNTMCGLHFAVSAGRCTRGVFMQLIRVTDDTLPFNYLLILDTEGIRASLDQTRRVFENELATFAIGLGNITILNIKGENTSEIENFLQIAVHACLRLKMVNKNLKMQQRCVFLHQNVDAHDADVRLKDDIDKLMHRLDEMVKYAALSEDRSDIFSFNQVIGIKPESDVRYFPNL